MIEFLKSILTTFPIDALVALIIGIGLILTASLSNKLLKKQNKIEERKIYLSVYDGLVEAFIFIGDEKYSDAVKVCEQTYLRARVALPKEIVEYIRKIKMDMASLNAKLNFSKKTTTNKDFSFKTAKEALELKNNLMSQKLKMNEIFIKCIRRL